MPSVTFACPGSKQRWPNSDACWSPSTPTIGTVPPSTPVEPNTESESTIGGSSAAGTPNSSSRSASHVVSPRPQSSVLPALLASVTCTAPALSA